LSARPHSHRRPSGLSGWIAVWFGAGLAPAAPGTAGSLAALPLGWLILWAAAPQGWLWLGIAALALLPIGVWAATRHDQATGGHDASEIVVDEVVGQWLALLPAVWSVWWHILLAFVLFRLFDILKPWPVGWADRQLPGGWGVMVDDVLAGLWAAALLWIVLYAESRI